jgi:hypothetical protein
MSSYSGFGSFAPRDRASGRRATDRALRDSGRRSTPTRSSPWRPQPTAGPTRDAAAQQAIAGRTLPFLPQPVDGPTPELAAFLASLPPTGSKGLGSLDGQSVPQDMTFPAPGGGGGGGGGGGAGFDGTAFDMQRQMLNDLYAQQLKTVQDQYEMGYGQIGQGLEGTLGSLGTIRDQYMAEAARMQQDQAAMLAGALGRVAQEQAALNADLAAQGGRTVDPAAVDARGLLEAQGANQASLQSRLQQLQAGAFADREGGAQSIAQGGRQQLDLQRLGLQDQILRERLQALTDVDVQRVQAEQAAAAARAGGGGGRGGRGGGGGGNVDGAGIDAAYGWPPGTYDSLPAETKNMVAQDYLGLTGPDPTQSDARNYLAFGPQTLDINGQTVTLTPAQAAYNDGNLGAAAFLRDLERGVSGAVGAGAANTGNVLRGLVGRMGTVAANNRPAPAPAQQTVRQARTPSRSGGTGRTPTRTARNTRTPTRG